jgi:hypothetical protein
MNHNQTKASRLSDHIYFRLNADMSPLQDSASAGAAYRERRSTPLQNEDSCKGFWGFLLMRCAPSNLLWKQADPFRGALCPCVTIWYSPLLGARSCKQARYGFSEVQISPTCSGLHRGGMVSNLGRLRLGYHPGYLTTMVVT